RELSRCRAFLKSSDAVVLRQGILRLMQSRNLTVSVERAGTRRTGAAPAESRRCFGLLTPLMAPTQSTGVRPGEGILYELLTGLRPIDAKRLRKAALAEMIRIIQEEEPSKPSTRLSENDSLPSLADVRQTEPKKLSSRAPSAASRRRHS